MLNVTVSPGWIRSSAGAIEFSFGWVGVPVPGAPNWTATFSPAWAWAAGSTAPAPSATTAAIQTRDLRILEAPFLDPAASAIAQPRAPATPTSLVTRRPSSGPHASLQSVNCSPVATADAARHSQRDTLRSG